MTLLTQDVKASARFSPRRRTGPSASSRPATVKASLLVRVLFTAAFVINAPAFTAQLGWDPGTGRFTGSPILSAMTVFSQIFTLGLYAASAEARQTLRRAWPILACFGLSLVSTLWSFNPKGTLDAALRTAPSFFIGVALPCYFPGFLAARFIARAMVLGCALSVFWVAAFPQIAVHQATDAIQSVHAGLWRGIFSHKQGLGYFAGVTVGLLLYFRTAIFPLPALLVSLGFALTALVGTKSATGMVTAVIAPALFAVARSVATAPPLRRKTKLLVFLAVLLVLVVAFKSGALNFMITHLLGKSTDMTGRADFWPLMLERFKTSGRVLLGAGIGTDFASELSEWSVDNGYLDVLFYFGYLLSPIVFFSLGAILVRSTKRLLASTPDTINIDVFCFGIMLVIIIANVTESNFLTKCWGTIVTGLVTAILFGPATSPPRARSRTNPGTAGRPPLAANRQPTTTARAKPLRSLPHSLQKAGRIVLLNISVSARRLAHRARFRPFGRTVSFEQSGC